MQSAPEETTWRTTFVIRGGDVIDGTGRRAFRADVAIDGDTITAIGDVAAPGRREIEARGLAVTPGFVDIHTHLDAQIAWDPLLTPISWHGVTSALLGNCGVTFAPVRPGDAPVLAGMMEAVEDIPARRSSRACRGTGKATAATSMRCARARRRSTSRASSATARCAST
jgi:N-acyl-D-aspartate/D-glutamate deacylase